MKFTAEVTNFYESALYGGHVIVPEKVSEKLIKQKIKRLVCILNGEFEFHCALMSKGGRIKKRRKQIWNADA